MPPTITAYNDDQPPAYRAVCERLAAAIAQHLPEAEGKIWHRQPVWFLDGNPVVGYSVQKPGVRLMFWSGADFDEPDLDVRGQKFRDASRFYTDVTQLQLDALARWLGKARTIQWDYAHVAKRKGRLERLR